MFRPRDTRPALAPSQVAETARSFWELPFEERSDEIRNDVLSNPDVVVCLCGFLREERETSPKEVFEEAAAIYQWLKSSDQGVGIFDERDYFLGEAAYLAGTCCRLLGRREDAARWLDRAEASFRHTVNPAPNMSNVAYARLGLSFEMGHHDAVLELVPSVRASFERLGMTAEAAKCHLLEAMVLKGQGRIDHALSVLEPIRSWESGTLDQALKGRILAEIGDLYRSSDQFDNAMEMYQEALSLLENVGTSQALADLKLFVGDAYRGRGQHEVALEAFRSALADYQELGMSTRVAYMRLAVADALLRLSRPREAEWELLAALPTIEGQKMVPEGFAAVELLKESVRRRKTDPNALRELREHLQAANQS
jgi:tetratricopeptide (TPR) repeat protein